MSIQWTLVAFFLYVEMAVLIVLLLPFIPAQRWQKLFKSRFLRSIENQISYYFYILLAILVLFLLDAVREMRKYSSEGSEMESTHGHHGAEMQVHMRLFRAQRNFYISGFSLFL
uniref:Endoplasmic reticulum transmembrane protein n=1 Tax=Xibalbanus tulumensis TaxID=1519145 RepID=A0A481SXX9_XIBTU|nr:bcr-associated protein [Xibalbanus tulumensis]